jgi:hypothetical protein
MASHPSHLQEPTNEEIRRDNLHRYISLAWRIHCRLRAIEEPRGLDESILYPYDADRKVDTPSSHH